MPKHLYGLFDEVVVVEWVDSPYWQKIYGEKNFQHQLPIDPSSILLYRKRIGVSRCERILQQTMKVEVKNKALKRLGLKRVAVDTTVEEKAVSYPANGQ